MPGIPEFLTLEFNITLRVYVTSSSDKQDMSVSSRTRVVLNSQTILLVLTLA